MPEASDKKIVSANFVTMERGKLDRENKSGSRAAVLTVALPCRLLSTEGSEHRSKRPGHNCDESAKPIGTFVRS